MTNINTHENIASHGDGTGPIISVGEKLHLSSASLRAMIILLGALIPRDKASDIMELVAATRDNTTISSEGVITAVILSARSYAHEWKAANPGKEILPCEWSIYALHRDDLHAEESVIRGNVILAPVSLAAISAAARILALTSFSTTI